MMLGGGGWWIGSLELVIKLGFGIIDYVFIVGLDEPNYKLNRDKLTL
jgi:hypothetical protein